VGGIFVEKSLNARLWDTQLFLEILLHFVCVGDGTFQRLEEITIVFIDGDDEGKEGRGLPEYWGSMQIHIGNESSPTG
jgi:hypothetical protein